MKFSFNLPNSFSFAENKLLLDVCEPYVALQSIGLLSPGNIHVRGESRILVEESPVLGLGRQVLSLLGVADVQHIQINTGDRYYYISPFQLLGPVRAVPVFPQQMFT